MKWILAIVLLLAACTRSPDPRVAVLAAHVEALGARVDRLEQALAATAAARPEPAKAPAIDPAATYALDVSEDPFVGPADALVTVVKAQDYACPFSARAEPTMAQLLAKYPGKLRVVYKDLLTRPEESTVSAHAACAAHLQGRFAAFNDALWTRAFAKDGSPAMMLTIARDLKLDLARFTADMNGEACREAVDKDMRALAAIGAHGTPTFYINGRHFSGAQPLARFAELVDEELARAEARVGKDGIAAASYYQKVVLAQGKTSP